MHQQSQLGAPGAADGGGDEHQRSPPASQSGDTEAQGRRHLRNRDNGDAAPDLPSKKRRKTNSQVNSGGVNRRRSNRDRRPTSKAAEER